MFVMPSWRSCCIRPIDNETSSSSCFRIAHVAATVPTVAFAHMIRIDEHGTVLITKTGMGSSAALTTSFVAALLQFFQVCVSVEQDLNLVHHVAQICHCAAQGKVRCSFCLHSFCSFGQSFIQSFIHARLDTTVEHLEPLR